MGSSHLASDGTDLRFEIATDGRVNDVRVPGECTVSAWRMGFEVEDYLSSS